MFSKTVPSLERVDLLREVADRASCGRGAARPQSRCSSPIRTLNSVDFPAPFLPSRPIRSPRTIEASTPSYRVWRP